MKIVKSKLVFITVAVLAVSFLFSSCNTGKGDVNSDVTTDGAPEAPIITKALQLVANGQSEYTICRPSTLPEGSGIIKACQELRSAISDLTGASLAMKDDWYRSESDIPEYEILIGNVNRPELEGANVQALGKSHFKLVIEGKKLLVLGGSDSAVCDGVAYLTDVLGSICDTSSKSITFTNVNEYIYTGESRIESLTVASMPISDYVIVLPKVYLASDYRTAVYLRKFIKENCGVSIGLQYDNAESSECEIRIGNTVRSGDADLSRHGYRVSVTGSTVQLSAASPYAYDAMLRYLTDVLFSPKNKNITVEDGFSFTADVSDTLTGGSENTMQKNGEYRIMFNNMFGSCDATLYPRALRQQQLCELYVQYSPDVIGLQEFNPACLSGTYAMDKLLTEAGYAQVAISGLTVHNYTPIFYNPRTVKVIDSGYLMYSDGMNDKSKSVSWAVLEGLDGGERFCVASTHFWYKSSAEGGDAGRLLDAAQLKEELSKVEAKHGTPIIVGGDFNCNTSSQPYARLTSSGYVNAISVAAKADRGRSYHSYPTYNNALGVFEKPVTPTGDYERSIDHIFIKGNGITVNTFDAVTDLYALLSTDHCPIYVDVDVN